MSEAIGRNGLKIIEEIAARKPGETVNILTHCNAGWLKPSITAPRWHRSTWRMTPASVHVWVDETRPRNQGAALTAFRGWAAMASSTPSWSTMPAAISLQAGQVDMVIVGTDRVTANGDVANKIGTYLKALAAEGQ